MELPVGVLALQLITDAFMQFNFILLDFDKLRASQVQHCAATDQLSRPRLPLSCVLLPFIDEQRLSSDMDWMFREVQKVSSFVQATSKKTSRPNGS